MIEIAKILDFSFFHQALIAGLLASVACGIVGTYVVVKEITSISGGISHAALGGVGLGYLLGFNPLIGAAIFAVISGLFIGAVYLKEHQSLDTLIAMVWSVGMALGVIFLALTPGYKPDLSNYLFGSILFVPNSYLFLVAGLDILLILTVFFLYKELQAITFDEEFASIMGVPINPLFLALLTLTSLAVVTLIRVVGVIMMIALLTTPAVIARRWSSNLAATMVLATVISAFCTTIGLFASLALSDTFAVDIPSGPLVIICAAICYFFSVIVGRRA